MGVGGGLILLGGIAAWLMRRAKRVSLLSGEQLLALAPRGLVTMLFTDIQVTRGGNMVVGGWVGVDGDGEGQKWARRKKVMRDKMSLEFSFPCLTDKAP